MVKNNKHHLLAAATLAFTLSGSAAASMGNLGTSYGVLPSDLATAQALSIFNTHASAAYYNPAALTQDPRGELTMGLMGAKPQLEINSLWSDGTVTRSGTNVYFDTPSSQVLLGMKTDLTNMTTLHKPTYLAVVIGMEKLGTEMLAFNSETSQTGQSFEYGRKPLFLTIGGGTELLPGISTGFSTRVTLHSSATMNASATLGGKTSYEQLTVSAEPQLRPIFGLNIDWGKALCGSEDCWTESWMAGIKTAFAYRFYSNTKTTVNSNITIPGTVPAPGVALAVTTLDSYQPNILSFGLLYEQPGSFRVGLTVEQQQWSKLEEELESDTIKDQAVKASIGQLQFRDIIVPRLGGQFWFTDHLSLLTGVAFRKSPLDTNTSLDINYLDSDKIIFGVGMRWEIEDPFILAYPMYINLGYQYQKLKDREFELYTSKGASTSSPRHYETVETSGNVSALSASITLKF